MAYRAALMIGGQRLSTKRFRSRAAAVRFARGMGAQFIDGKRAGNPQRYLLHCPQCGKSTVHHYDKHAWAVCERCGVQHRGPSAGVHPRELKGAELARARGGNPLYHDEWNNASLDKRAAWLRRAWGRHGPAIARLEWDSLPKAIKQALAAFFVGKRKGNPSPLWEILRDGRHVAFTDNPLKWFHDHHSYSMDHAVKHEGYKVKPTEFTYEGQPKRTGNPKRRNRQLKRPKQWGGHQRGGGHAYIDAQWAEASGPRRAAILKRAGVSSGWAGLDWAGLPGAVKGKLAAFLIGAGMDRGTRRRRARRAAAAGNPQAHLGLYDSIRPGARVTIVDSHGQKRTGRAVMRGPAGWVLNLGGRYGTPGIADRDNVVRVTGGGRAGSGDSPAGALIRSVRGNPKRRNAGKRRTKCECSDPGCPVGHGSKECGRKSAGKVYRSDMADRSGTAMCSECLDDALKSGVFYTK